MLGRVTSIDPLTDPRWDGFVQRHPRGGLFHSSAWIELTQRSFAYRPAHLAYEVGGKLEAVLPLVMVQSVFTGKRLVSLPFSGPAGPLGTSEQSVQAVVAAAVQQSSDLGCSYLNLQTCDELPGASKALFVHSQPMVRSVVPLTADPSELWMGRLRKTTRQNIGQARKAGVFVKVGQGRDELKTFYDLHIQTHRKHGIPPMPLHMFRTMHSIFGQANDFWVLTAYLDDRPINSTICVGFKDVLNVLYIGTSYRYIRSQSTKLLDWSAIELGIARGYSFFDMLLSDVENEGLRFYKKSFGSLESPVSFYYYPKAGGVNVLKDELVRGQSGVAKLARTALRRMPTVGLKVLGNLVFRHMG